MSIEAYEGGPEPIAVVGLGGRLPGARDVAEFWRNQRDGVESVRPLEAAELLAAGVPPGTLADPDYVRAAGVVDGADRFDAGFWGYSPREAETLDPQHRVFLEVAWEALEDAGHDPARFPGAVGVFAGTFMNKYLAANLYASRRFVRSPAAAFARIFNDKDFLATRVSYLLNLRGPAVTVQTACSTSLVATHLACQSLWSYDSDMALAGGVALNLPLLSGYTVMEGGLFTPEGHCRPFDARARGTVPGYGAGVVVLRRLGDALADGDHVRALIRATAVNNDGSAKVGFTAPSVDAQAQVVAAALALAGVDPETIGYLEAHGTGTPVGDPIELAALTEAFRARTARRGFCALGSVKANIGHLDAAAGVAGLMRAVLALEHRQIPPHANFAEPNPRLEIDRTPFYVPVAARPWPAEGAPRRAGVSSFGVGGTNAHAVLEEAPAPEPAGPAREWQLLPLSARSRAEVEAASARLADHLEAHPRVRLADVAFTLQAGRREFPVRRFAVARTAAEAVQALRSGDARRLPTAEAAGDGARRQVVYMFPGGGTQHPDMGLEVYRAEPVFRAEIDRCAEILRPRLGFDLRRYLYPSLMGDAGVDREHVPAVLCAIISTEIALAGLWASWGVQPHALIGHSLGEYAAACLAGVFSLEDALAVTVARGELFAAMPPGRMMTVALPEEAVRPLLGGRLSIAAVNAPGLTLVSGPEDAVDALAGRLAAEQVECRRVHIQVASHSWMVEPFLPAFTETVARCRLNPPRIPLLSGVTGTWMTPDEAVDPAYWARHLRQPVRFADGVREAASQPGRILLEVGPGNALTSLAGAQGMVPAPPAIPSMRHPREPLPDLAFLLGAAGRLWQAGLAVDWRALHGDARPRRVPLPTYPFARKRHWVDPDAPGQAERRDAAAPLRLAGWRRTLPAAPAAPGPGTWLLLDDGSAPGDALAQHATALGRTVVRVRRGASPVPLADGGAALDAGDAEQVAALFRGLAAEGRAPSGIVHLWALGEACAGAECGFHGLLPFARAAGEGVRVLVVADGVAPVEGAATPARAALAGAARAVGGRCVDVRAADPAARLAEALAAELDAGGAERVALRAGVRWEHVYQASALDGGGADGPAPDGAWVFTAGLRGGNAPLAAAAARAGTPLVLLQPAGFPPREGWDAWTEQDEAAAEIRRIRSLEEEGARVRIEPLESAVAPSLGPVAVVLAGGAEHQGEADGAAALRRAAREAELATAVAGAHGSPCVLQSSSAAFLGAAAAAESAAMHFLAAAAEHGGPGGEPWLSVAWGPWRGEGSAAGVDPDEAVALLRRLLARRAAGHVLVPGGTAEPAPAEPAAEPEEEADGLAGPRTPRERAVAEVWREMLGVDRVGVDDDFFALGGHSLMVAQMLKRLKQVFRAPLAVRDLYDATTVASLAALLDEREGAGAGQAARGVDLAAEAALDPAVTAAGLPAWTPAPPHDVFLTGATGFLGAFLVAELLRQTGARVHCLVRAADADEGRRRLVDRLSAAALLHPGDEARIVPVPGDLAQPRFGLREEEFRVLAERVEAVYHCGAWVNFARPYRTLKATNVGGTEEVLRLATTARLKPVHHVSTLAVLAGAFLDGAAEVMEDAPLPPPVGHDTGYSQSKWVAEQVIGLARARGVPVSVYRPGVVLADSRTGVANADDYITRLLQGCVHAGLAPLREYPLAVGAADHVARCTVALSLRPETLGRTYHTIDPEFLPWNRVWDHVRAFGYAVRSVPFERWKEELGALVEREPENNALEPLLGLLSDAAADRRTPRFDTGNVRRGLAGTALADPPPLDAGFFAAMLGFMVRSGWLPAPPRPPAAPVDDPRPVLAGAASA